MEYITSKNLYLIANGERYEVTYWWQVGCLEYKFRLAEVVEGTIHNGDVVAFEEDGKALGLTPPRFFVVATVRGNTVGTKPNKALD